jgi:hypothetical protein
MSANRFASGLDAAEESHDGADVEVGGVDVDHRLFTGRPRTCDARRRERNFN